LAANEGIFQQCSMARHGPPRRYENEPPPRLFSHQADKLTR
jgi:hypothetical protein